MKKRIKAIHLGVSGFPFGTAAINRCLNIYQSLIEYNVNVLVINRRAIHKKDIPIKIKKLSTFNSISYIYTSISPYKSDHFFVRRISNFWGRINEFYLLIKLLYKKEIDLIFYYPDGTNYRLILYRIISVVFRIPIICHYVEFRSKIVKRQQNLKFKISDYLFDNFFFYFVDAIIPISDYLCNYIVSKSQKKPFLKIPPIVDFNLFNKKDVDKNNSFLYCGSAQYDDSLNLILKAFETIESTKYSLTLILSGSCVELKYVQELIVKHKFSERIFLKSNLLYEDLILEYLRAVALLVPLRNTIQDVARFPNKIAEYLATGNPILTMNFGEVKNYFKHNINAFVAESYSIEDYAKLMNSVIENPEKAVKIGMEGKKMGELYFDSKAYGEKIATLIKKIKKI